MRDFFEDFIHYAGMAVFWVSVWTIGIAAALIGGKLLVLLNRMLFG